MPNLEALTFNQVVEQLTPDGLGLAQVLVRFVQNPVRDGQTIRARVADRPPCDVKVTAEPDGYFWACSCGRSERCPHVNAVLLKWLQEPWAFEQQAEGHPQRELAVVEVEPLPTQKPAELPYWVQSPFAQWQQVYMERLESWLGRVKMQDLRQMAARRGWTARGNSKAILVRHILEAVAEPEGILKTALSLDEEHLRVLTALALLGASPVDPDTLESLAGALGALDRYKLITTYLNHLCELGLALPGTAADDYAQNEGFCPGAIARHLLPALQRALPAAITTPPAVDAAHLRLADPWPFLRAVHEVAQILEQEPTPLRPPMPRPVLEKQYPALRGWDYVAAEVAHAARNRSLQAYWQVTLVVPPPRPSLPDEVVARLAPIAGDEERLEFTYSLLVATGLLQPGSPTTVWPEVKVAFLRAGPLAQRAILARTYFHMCNWTEFWAQAGRAQGALQIRRRLGGMYQDQQRMNQDLALARLLVLRVLACLPQRQWIDLEELFGLLRHIWPQFESPRQPADLYLGARPNWYLARQGADTRLPTTSPPDWDLAQGGFVREMLSGPLHWLGLTDLALDDTGDLRAFRLHGLADLYWNLSEAPPAPHSHNMPGAEPAEPPTIDIDGLQLAVHPSALDARGHNLLERIARLEEATAERFVYRLDATIVQRSYEAGMTVEEIMNAWERLLPLPLPEAMRARLADWWSAYGRVRLYRDLTVIEFADDYALAEVKAVTSLARHIVAEISPRLIIIDKAAAPGLIAQLEKAGYTPKQTERLG